MTSNIFLISDNHFNHKNIIKFTRENGQLLRPGFSCIEEHNEHMIDCWNRVVTPGSKVYCLGDFGDPAFANRLIGSKRLILGNHDVDLNHLIGKFKKVQAWRRFREEDISFAMTHFPILLSNDHRGIQFNLHGHIHDKLVLKPNGQPDLRYINLCVEHINYTPVHMDEVLKMMKTRLKTFPHGETQVS